MKKLRHLLPVLLIAIGCYFAQSKPTGRSSDLLFAPKRSITRKQVAVPDLSSIMPPAQPQTARQAALRAKAALVVIPPAPRTNIIHLTYAAGATNDVQEWDVQQSHDLKALGP